MTSHSAKVALLIALVALQTVALLVLLGVTKESMEEADLLRERVQLLEAHVVALHRLRDAEARLCDMRGMIGDAYREALASVVRRLGLDEQPGSAVRLVLDAFEGVGGGVAQ